MSQVIFSHRNWLISHSQNSIESVLQISLRLSLPIFDLYEITYKAVRSTALHKVLLRTKEPFRVWPAKLAEEVVEERQFTVLLDLMKRDGVDDGVYEAAVV